MSDQALRIAFVSSEVAPFAKTGGLADVSAALPKALARLGHETCLFMPAYAHIAEHCQVEQQALTYSIQLGQKVATGSVARTEVPVDPNSDQTVTCYFIQQQEYFERPGIYGERGHDYPDNCERFTFFCRAVLEVIHRLGLPFDIIHCNDWQTGLIPAYLQSEYQLVPTFEQAASVFTIHNLAYQGRFWQWDMLLTGLDWKYFNWRQMEFYGDLNLLKTGIVFSDYLTTVSPTYAQEIQSVEFGHGLDSVLRERRGRLRGIMNGIDHSIWDPETDPKIAANYTAKDWQHGKSVCKQDLQKTVGLEEDSIIPVIGLVGRLASQKGWSILLPLVQQWLASGIDVQWVVLGTGDQRFERELNWLASQYPKRIAVCLTFSDELAHKIEAGSDIFLMPSEYEPCGLNQLYSLRYGAVPVVRQTGGLADSIVDATDQTIAAKAANGFSFRYFMTTELETALARAVVCYMDHPESWKKIVETGMRQDWSWEHSADAYAKLYRRARQIRNNSSARAVSQDG